MFGNLSIFCDATASLMNTLFVFMADITEHPLREHFEDCGNVEAVRLVRDRESGMGKGFGYVLFEVKPGPHKGQVFEIEII